MDEQEEDCVDGKFSKKEFVKQMNLDKNIKYRVYPSRWGIFITVVMFNLSNNALWICIGAVGTKAAAFYNVGINDIDLLSTIFLYVGIPCCFALTWFIDKFGLRKTIGVGISVTFACGIVRLITAIPGIREHLGKEEQYWLIFVSQIFNGLGNPAAICIATKVSQNWFAGAEQIFVTVSLAFSPLLGTMFSQALTPALVKTAEDIPTMNWVWPIFSTITMIMFVFLVRTSLPPTPPSKSAEMGQNKMPYIQSMKMLLANKIFLVLMLVLGSGLGFFNVLATQVQQFACARGYSDEFSGLAVTVMIIAGVVGSTIMGGVVVKTGRIEEVMKICGGIACLIGFGIAQLLRKPNIEWEIYTGMAIFGIFSFAYYTIGLEFNVELTYPVDQAIGTAMIFACGQIQAAIFILVSGAMEGPLTPEASKIERCSISENPSIHGYDHTHFMIFLTIYLAVVTAIMLIFVKTDYKRRLANEGLNKNKE